MWRSSLALLFLVSLDICQSEQRGDLSAVCVLLLAVVAQQFISQKPDWYTKRAIDQYNHWSLTGGK